MEMATVMAMLVAPVKMAKGGEKVVGMVLVTVVAKA